ncbi:hypothetical protein PGTUg99_028500 [Puccinia graminis f. sp. tritici]|uniref:Uncharacterized protein n=1 Tax=Puccinia graminis f. sp. tritici TaxID=56615 RepID=A0A5B0MIC4_PUCGR|nr:hypothetical protein PGTUg99_028500 [Puccinia graminis f. sp. tritici]
MPGDGYQALVILRGRKRDFSFWLRRGGRPSSFNKTPSGHTDRRGVSHRRLPRHKGSLIQSRGSISPIRFRNDAKRPVHSRAVALGIFQIVHQTVSNGRFEEDKTSSSTI